jgi:PleD family two-component response regulator
MSKPRLLIVDDDADISNMLHIYFSGIGYDVLAGRRGLEVLEKARQYLPNLILLDIVLPDINGFEVFRRLRTHMRTRHIPVIFLTQRDLRSDRLQGLEMGVDDYIAKPFDVDELRLRVQNVVARAELELLTDARTGLPAGRLVGDHLKSILTETGWTLFDIRINHYIAYLQAYGQRAGEDVLRFTANLIAGVADEYGSGNDFIGSAGEDNFILVTSDSAAPELRRRLKKRFAAGILSHYNYIDRQQGCMIVPKRTLSRQEEHEVIEVPFMSLSIGAVSPSTHEFSDLRQVTELVAEERRLDAVVNG